MKDEDLERIFSELADAPAAAVRARLLAHATLLAKWNRTHNLTSLVESQWPEVHFYDSWLLEPLARQGVLIDVGSGGGFPGLVLLAAAPARFAVFFEKVEKKRAFLRTALASLGYANARVADGNFPPPALPSGEVTFVSRATWAPAEWLAIAGGVARSGDSVITQSAAEPAPEAPPGWQRDSLVQVELPISKAARTLARYKRDGIQS